MDKNMKALSYVAGVLVSFIVAALFQYVFVWGATVAITVCALANLFFLTAPQSLDRRAPGGFRAFLFILAMIAGFVFALMFMSWTMLAIYMASIVAATIVAIVRA